MAEVRVADSSCTVAAARGHRYVSYVSQDNLDALGAHLLFAAEHRKPNRHSNLIEPTFGKSRRRVKVIGRLPGERSCLSLVRAVLDRAAKGWRGLAMTPSKALRRLQDLRRELHGQPRPLYWCCR